MFIHSERTGDQEAIRAVHALSFPTPWEADLVDRLRDAGKLSVSLVAEVNRTVVGHIAISPVSTKDGHVGAGLGPLAVWEFYRRQGIGTQLVEAGLATCRSARLGWAVALGDPN